LKRIRRLAKQRGFRCHSAVRFDIREWPNCNTREISVDAQIRARKSPYATARIMLQCRETVPVVANGGIGDTTGTVPFARKALHFTPFPAVAGLKLC